MRQNPDTYNVLEIQCMHSRDSARLFVDRIEYDTLRAENAELRRLIKDVAIPALDYSAKSWIGAKSSDPVRTALATLQDAVK